MDRFVIRNPPAAGCSGSSKGSGKPRMIQVTIESLKVCVLFIRKFYRTSPVFGYRLDFGFFKFMLCLYL